MRLEAKMKISRTAVLYVYTVEHFIAHKSVVTMILLIDTNPTALSENN